MRKPLAVLMAATMFFIILLTACHSKSTQDIVSQALGMDVSSGSEISRYDTHSGNGDGTSCIALSFSDDTILEEVKGNTDWKTFPLDETAKALAYGVEDETSKTGPYLTDENGNPLVPEIHSGYYRLIDRQAENSKSAGADILNRYSFNFTLGLYDTDTNTLYFCELDT